MGDIELVVKLDEADYISIKNAINSLIGKGVERASMSKVCLAILDGTPLPKGHGRLIDADYKVSSDGRTIDAVCGYMAPTIIEADREVKI